MQQKPIIWGFLSGILIMIIIGIYVLNSNQQTIVSFQTGEKHFASIATAATKISSYAKRAEGHLLLYLVLHRNADKKKFPKRIASLHEQILILDQKINNPVARVFFKKIKTHSSEILTMGNTLISYHDKELEEKSEFGVEKHQEMIFKLHENFSAIRELGVNLAEFEIKLEADQKLNSFENVRRLRFYVILLICLIFGFTTFLGYMLNRMINTLNEEIVKRRQSEKIILQESNKLKEALARVKVLSGMLPICAACKKIRDDKGYWNQIESYIKKRSDAEFSHSICPECEKKLYPNLFD